MIVLPTRGISRSIKAHNVKLNVLCDWVEASVVFCGDPLSQADVIDSLLEEEVYADQDFASEIVADVWRALSNRVRLSGGSYTISVESRWVRVNCRWTEKPAHAFCLLLSLAPAFDWWVQEFGPDYNEQGYLFELLIDESIRVMAPGWMTHLTAWSRSHAVQLKQVAKEVADRLCCGVAQADLWDTLNVKELALDLLLYRPFPDGRQGFPYFLVQCASGDNWDTKLTTPDLNVWTDILRPATKPMRGVAVPFCFSDDEFRRNCVQVTGLFLDRCRLLGASVFKPEWVPQDLIERIVAWARPRVGALMARR
jgi:hypothetical protein